MTDPWLRSRFRSVRLAGMLALGGCTTQGSPEPDAQLQTKAKATPAEAHPSGRAQYVHAGDGPVAPLVQAEQKRAKVAGQRLLVYVGAPWCEPCTAFHDAVVNGSLDGQLPPLRLLEFNLDKDRDRLAEAGYSARLIPIFAVPRPDGHASELRMIGGVKGERAVDNIKGRLLQLLAKADTNTP